MTVLLPWRCCHTLVRRCARALTGVVGVALMLVANVVNAGRPYAGGAVAAEHHLASSAGAEMLSAGGNAVDAAAAAAFVLAVVAPYHSGLGGGGFALVHLVDAGVPRVLDFRETAPAAASRDMYLSDGGVVPRRSLDGALAVAVPSAVQGYLSLHQASGALPRAKVLAPAIRHARQGFAVTPWYRSFASLREACLRSDPEAARLFLRPGDGGVPTVPANGTVLRQPELARTLEAIAQRGAAAFTQGPVAESLVRAVQRGGGLLTKADLTTYAPVWRQPLEGSYRGHRVVTMPPPSGGGVTLLQVLAMLDAHGPRGPASHEVETIHFTVEALRRAFVDRSRFIGDPAFVDVPVARLLSVAHLSELRASIDLRRATPSRSLEAGVEEPSSPVEKNTAHVSVIDRQGNAVALTTTVNGPFGSCLVVPGAGVLLNNQMDDFAAQPGATNATGLVQGEVNAISPGKRPASSMTPTLVFQKGRPSEVLLAVGSPGSSTIPTTVLQVISNVVDAQLDVERAVGAPRFHHQWWPDEVMLDEPGLDPATLRALETLGHRIKRRPRWGDAEAVMVDPVSGLRSAASDPRNEGQPAGTD